jgi:hypothetical protein
LTILLALDSAATTGKSLEVRAVEKGPRIDGVLEDIWLQADSVSDFTQSEPDEGQPPSERTVVRVLQDRENLYVAFCCYAAHSKPIAAPWGMEEEATVYLDPMNTRDNACFFKVYASGLYRSGKVLDDGADQDWSWEAVWCQADRLYDDRWEVEFRIPFKSIRYEQGATEWGVNFHRFITHGIETDYWTVANEREGGNRVSQYGRLKDINPQSHGYYFELFPEGFVRYDQDGNDTSTVFRDFVARLKPSASLNFKWDLTPQTTVNATVLPDFAQIESDPYSFNLSRYPTRLSERRPFFVEGSELFRMSGLGEGIFSPLEIFYSRRIGRVVGEEPVPILSGLKLTTRSSDWSFGALGAYTDQLADSGVVLEPRRSFAVLSGRGRLADATDAGLLFAGTMARSDDYNYALGLDLSRGLGFNRSVLQAAVSDHNGTPGWAVTSGYRSFIGNWLSMGAVEVISDSFSVEDIGFVPWAGRKHLQVMTGPYFRPQHSELTRMLLAPVIYIGQEPGARAPSYSLTLTANPQLRSGWEFTGEASAGSVTEADTTYFGRSVNLSANGSSLDWNLNFGLNGNYSYNYARGYLADNYSDWLFVTYYLAKRVALMAGGTNYWERDPVGKVAAVTSILRPRIDYRINAQMSFNVYDEVVLLTPGTRFDSTRLATNRVGFLYSWNFLPKSWLYVAFNDFRVDVDRKLTLANRVGAIKLRYLFYF